MAQELMNINKIKITNLLLDRDEERKKDINEKKIVKNLKSAQNEHILHFRDEFDKKQNGIVTDLKEIEENNLSVGDLPNRFDQITVNINLLQQFVSSSTLFLKEYEVRRCQEIIHNLILQSKELESKYLPKKKFGFKNKKFSKPTVNNNTNSADESDFKSKHLRTINNLEFCGFKLLNDESVSLQQEDLFKKDVTLNKLTNCTVRLHGSPSTLHINELKNCTVLTGPVTTSIFIEKCIDCKFIIACQQLRLHSSNDCQIYLHVTSRAIMEDCRGIGFAPYNWCYDNLDNDFKLSGLDRTINNWNCIDDFNWLALDQQSPNWFVLGIENIVDKHDK